jgi:LCP family protein required for cell wall assembly
MPSLYAQMPNNLEPPPYKLYRSGPKGLKARLRGEEDLGLGPERPGRDRDGRPGRRRWYRGRLTWKRGLLYLATAVVAWLVLSLVLFLISAQIESGKVPNSAKAALSSGGNMLTSTDTVLILGTDQRPKGSKEPGANTNDAGSRSDTIMLWRIGGGTSRRLSIPRDTVVPIPGHGDDKINAAYAYGGPALAIKTVEQFARNEGVNVKINHLIIVNLAAFPDFINAIGGVTVTTGRICSEISGGVQNGGYTLNLKPGTHHLNGSQALTFARTRENRCNPADSDLTRVKHQQQILNGIKSQLFSPGTFFRLPWASWYAPKVLRTDMGGPTLLSLFAASELGGSAPVKVLKVTSSGTGTGLSPAPGASGQFRQLMNG